MREIHRHPWGQKHPQHVAQFVARVWGDLQDVLTLANQSFAEQKSGGQLLVVSGGAHGHDDRPAIDLEFKGLLAGQLVSQAPRPGPGLPPQHPAALGLVCLAHARAWI